MTEDPGIRRQIWTQTIVFLAGSGLAIGVIYHWGLRPRTELPALALALSVAALQAVLLLVITVGIVARKWRSARRLARKARVTPKLREHLARYAANGEGLAELRTLSGRYPWETESALVGSMRRVTGSSRARLAPLVTELGFLARWQEMLRKGGRRDKLKAIARFELAGAAEAIDVLLEALRHPEHDIVIGAGRALLRVGKPELAEEVFAAISGQSLIVRAALSPYLMKEAVLLSGNAIPKALRDPDTDIRINALEMVAAWRLYLPLEGLDYLVVHPEPRIARRALALLAYTPDGARYEYAVMAALGSPDPSVRKTACEVAGRMRLSSALEPLDRLLDDADTGVRVSAAYGLARQGSAGLSRLQEIVYSERQNASASALEALTMARIGRLQMVTT